MYPLRRALFALAISMAVPLCAAQAATFTVDRNDDLDINACSTAANDCSLRGAINKANATAGDDTINFASDVRGTILLGGTQLPTVTTGIAINGPGADQLTLSADSKSIILASAIGSQLTVNGLTLTRGNSAINNKGALILAQCVFNENVIIGGSGSALNNSGTVSIAQSSFTNNSCYSNGGAILNSGTLTMSNSTVANNRSVITSGGGIYNSGTATVTGSTISDNSADGSFSGSSGNTTALGGGVYNSGDFTLRKSTLSGNRISYYGAGTACGGAICSQTGSLVLDSCTITNNKTSPSSGVGKGSGISIGGNVTIGNSILSGNGVGDVDIASSNPLNLTDKGTNLIGTGTAIPRFNGAGNKIGADPKLGTFSNNGGTTQTYELLPGSAAIDAGNTTLTTDQRGIARPQGSAADIGAYEAQSSVIEARSLVVTTLRDVISNEGKTSLREAILYANTLSGPQNITFAGDVRGTLEMSGTQFPPLTGQTNLVGPGASALNLKSSGKSRILQIAAGATSVVTGLTFSNGSASNPDFTGAPGGAIFNEGTLSVRASNFDKNGGRTGGAIANLNSLDVENSTFTNGYGSISGGAISSGARSDYPVVGATTNATTTIRNSTFDGNGAGYEGGAIVNIAGNTSLDSCTITANRVSFVQNGSAGGGVASYDGQGTQTTIKNSIISGNTELDVAAIRVTSNPFVSGNFNLIGNGSTAGSGNAVDAFNKSGDQTGVTDPKLAPLADNGGATQTRALLADSPALNRGNTTLTADQRGIARPQGNAADIGAFELQAATPPPTEMPSLIVTTTADVVANDGQTSLREAIKYANSKSGADTISFAGNVRGKITLKSRLPKITDGLSINGPGAPLLAIDGDGKVKLLQICSGMTVDVNYLTLSGALYNASQGPEGAVLNEGNLTMREVAMTGNVGIEGGAITNLNGSVVLSGCQISGNSALNGGGGLLNNNGTLLVINSTISNNSAVGNVANASGGGGISTFGENARVTLEYVTMTGNSAPNVKGNKRAGVWVESGIFIPHNSIFYGNGNRDLQIDGGSVNSTGYNIVGKTNRPTSLVGTDRLNIDPQLGSLADNGGSTKTQALWPGSPAINTGDPNISNGSDQRGLGFLRRRGGRIDVGAFEVQSGANSASRPSAPSAPSAVSASPASSGGSS